MPTINPIVVKKGGVTPPTTGDYKVTFIDYDATILKEQWVDSGNSATAPTIPTHTGLTFIKWSNDFSNITEDMTVGSVYETTDGKTHAFVTFTAVTSLVITLYLNKSDTSTLTVDWGDGSSNTFTNSGNFNTGAHAYASAGDYEITLWMSSGSGTYSLGNATSTTTFVGGNVVVQMNTLTKVWIGENVINIGNYAFSNSGSLKAITIPDNFTTINTYAFRSCFGLKAVIIPNSVKTFGNYVFTSCQSLSYITIPDNLTSIGNSCFTSCWNLSLVKIPNSVMSLGSSLFNSCYSIGKINVNEGITTIGNSFCTNCAKMNSIIIPSTITYIGDTAFNVCRNLLQYQVLPSVPPTLANTNAFSGINSIAKIYVPDASVTAYKTATNWSTYANYIYPLSNLP